MPLNPAASMNEIKNECDPYLAYESLNHQILVSEKCFLNSVFVIYDQLARPMKSGTVISDKIEISDLPQGVYFLHVLKPDLTKYTYKFVRL
jgi:hypothetical protein